MAKAPAKPPSKPDRRAQVRRDVNREFASDEEFILEYVSNVSRTGVFIRTDDPLPIGTRVNLKFTVIMDDVEHIEGIGKVVRVDTDPPGMGVVFTSLSEYSQKLISRLLIAPQDFVAPS